MIESLEKTSLCVAIMFLIYIQVSIRYNDTSVG